MLQAHTYPPPLPCTCTLHTQNTHARTRVVYPFVFLRHTLNTHTQLPPCRSYRKTLIANVASLNFVEDRPVMEVERLAAEAWLSGGKEAEKAAKEKFINAGKDKDQRNHEAWQKMIQEGREKRQAADQVRAEAQSLAAEAGSDGEDDLPELPELEDLGGELQAGQVLKQARADGQRKSPSGQQRTSSPTYKSWAADEEQQHGTAGAAQPEEPEDQEGGKRGGNKRRRGKRGGRKGKSRKPLADGTAADASPSPTAATATAGRDDSATAVAATADEEKVDVVWNDADNKHLVALCRRFLYDFKRVSQASTLPKGCTPEACRLQYARIEQSSAALLQL